MSHKMQVLYTVQVSDHPDALMPGPATQEVVDSWRTVFDGPCGKPRALAMFKSYREKHAHVRVFRGRAGGVGAASWQA